MKKIILLLAITASMASCKKCYECETQTHADTFCKGDWQYDAIKHGGTLTDSVGFVYHCK